MPEQILIIILLPLLGCFFAAVSPQNQLNAYKVAIFTLLANIVAVLMLFAHIDITDLKLQETAVYRWLGTEHGVLVFGADTFSLVLLLGIYLSLIIGMFGLNAQSRRQKSLMVLTLYFTCNMNAFLTAGDIISFYVFFAGMLLPLFMLVTAFGNIKKTDLFYRFFLYNFCGVLCLLAGTLVLYKFYGGNAMLSEISVMDMHKHAGILVWGAVCLAFVSRIPVWPFHYWISAVSSSIRNPLVYIVVNLMPLTGLYGFVRFWPLSVPESMLSYLPYIEGFGVMTMIFIALIGMANREFFYKLFSYTTVYYLLFLLAVILPTDTLMMNIAYSLFIFLIVTSSLVILALHIESKCQLTETDYHGILAYMPRCSILLSFFILTAIGLPVSSLFWNNFVLISAILHESFPLGMLVMFSLILIAGTLLHELYVLREFKEKSCELEDISGNGQLFFAGIVSVLFLSFFNPLWFVF